MTYISLSRALLMGVALAFSVPASAQDHEKTVNLGDLTISDIWARTTPPTAKTGAAYFTIKNNGASGDVLIGAATNISKKTEIHETKMANGVMKMRHVGKVSIPAGGRAALAPGGYHIMLMGLHAPIREGDRFPLTLTFEKAGQVDIMVPAKKAGMTGQMNHGSMEHKDPGGDVNRDRGSMDKKNAH